MITFRSQAYSDQFSNLLGTVYCSGNLTFTPDGTCLLSPVGNRVTVFDLIKYEIEIIGFGRVLTFLAISPTHSHLRIAEI